MVEDNSFSSNYHALLNMDFVRYQRQSYRLGLDFGTSFTKASYSIEGDNGGIVFYQGKRTKASVVYFDKTNQTLSISKTSEHLVPIHYFKATMAGKEEYDVLKEKEVLKEIEEADLRDSFELLCSIFFIANIIKFCDLYISDKYRVNAISSVSMGMPMSWSNSKSPIYNKALNAALVLLDNYENTDISRMSLKDIYRIYEESLSNFDNDFYDPKNPNSANMTIPEVVTETNHVLNNRNIEEGNYCIIDIGGGTADFSFITKESFILTKELYHYCHYALVRELGDEVRKKKEELGELARYKAAFSSAFNECCVKAKDIIGKRGQKIKVKVFLFGGGVLANGDFYKSIIIAPENIKLLEQAQIEVSVSIQENVGARFIIANQLAKSDDGLKLLSGIPLY